MGSLLSWVVIQWFTMKRAGGFAGLGVWSKLDCLLFIFRASLWKKVLESRFVPEMCVFLLDLYRKMTAYELPFQTLMNKVNSRCAACKHCHWVSEYHSAWWLC